MTNMEKDASHKIIYLQQKESNCYTVFEFYRIHKLRGFSPQANYTD
jgi:hypothetical protein